ASAHGDPAARAVDAHDGPAHLPRPQDLHRAAAALRPVSRIRPVPLAAAAGLRDGQASAGQGRPAERGPSPSGTMMPSPVLAAAIQMNSTAEVERNLDTAERLVSAAAQRGARLVGLPENFAFLRSE